MKMEREIMKVIEKQVYDTYPVTKKEKKCAQKKQNMEEKRGYLKKRLMEEYKEGKRQYGAI
jgi:hypothetical protein